MPYQTPSSARSIPTTPLVNRAFEKAVSRLLVVAALLTPLQALAAPSFISPKTFRTRQLTKTPLTLIDIRPPDAYKKEHIQGALSVPLETLRTWQPPSNAPIVVYCVCPKDEEAAAILIERGFTNTTVLEGRFAAWKNAGYPVVRYGRGVGGKDPPLERIDAKRAKPKVEDGSLLPVDVRPEAEYRMGRLPGAVHEPLERIRLAVPAFPEGKTLLVYGRVGARAREAAKTLRQAGYAVTELSGGIAGWAAKKYPMEVE